MKKRISIFLTVLFLLAMAGCGQRAGKVEGQGSSCDLENPASVERPEQDTDATESAGEQGVDATEPADTEKAGEENSKVLVAYFPQQAQQGY